MTNPGSILVVDDFVDAREMLAEYLRFCGYDVLEASSGEEALALVRNRQPKMVLMDLTMPSMDGWEATRKLKANPATRDIIVIAVTAHALMPDEAAARGAGCDGYVAKPYDLKELAALVGRALREGAAVLRRENKLASQTSRPRASRKPPKR